MTTKRCGVYAAAACVLAMGAAGIGVAGAGAPGPDSVRRADGLETRTLASVAILPAVSIDENAAAERRVERAWLAFFGDARTRWMPPDEVRSRLSTAAGEPDGSGGSVESQIWRNGEVDAESAERLARALAVDALLSLRVDRWEFEDGGRGVVELTVALTGADGSRLWRVSGLAGNGGGRRSDQGNFTWDLSWVWDARLEPTDQDRRIGTALYNLLGRWTPELPQGLIEGLPMSPALARVQASGK